MKLKDMQPILVAIQEDHPDLRFSWKPDLDTPGLIHVRIGEEDGTEIRATIDRETDIGDLRAIVDYVNTELRYHG